ncbi:tetratricopeptide repeat protein 35-B-like protein [Hesseltinella vesiculosa]|uniref:ER membrane protein complex subunit 2 n=1 Tax=Hesseltinella vesiculosa TaxID=101127 RepID=A0A1X2GDV3_9FUNG|nr:tetratricopeptide repeat protein 35-B-like protein [Hesseltinella vesiculosa]
MESFNYDDAVEELKTFRQTNERQSERVCALGAKMMRDKLQSKLGDEVWPFYEQVCIAAMDTGDKDLTNYCIQQLQARFGESSLRFRRLLGMKHEASGRLEEAQKVYDSILAEDETNMLTSKRQIALLKTRNKIPDMIKALTKYLDTYYDDAEAWLELCDAYLNQYEYDQAAFCCEELLLLQPNNHLIYLKYAEILYTVHRYDLALKHYCKVLDLCPDYTRALYGLHLTSSKLLNDTSSPHASDLHALATERLLHIYSQQPHQPIVQDYLAQPTA